MEKATAEMILEQVTKHGPISASNIASRLSLSSADVRYHLTRLLRLGLISPSEPLPSQNRGRPATRYVASTSIAPISGNLFFEMMLSAFSHLIQEGNKDVIHQSIHKYFSTSAMENLNRIQRIIKVVGMFKQKGYESTWEARPGAPIVVLHRCPYISLLSVHPEICEFDRTALEITLGCPVKMNRTRVNDLDLPCQFSIQV